jgi:hypothetical protein
VRHDGRPRAARGLGGAGLLLLVAGLLGPAAAPGVPWAVGRTPPAVTRGPYLQLATPASVVVRWRTDVPTVGRVCVGPAPGALATCHDEAASGTEHAVTLGGLAPATSYHYAVGTPWATLAGDDAGHRFTTAPRPGTAVPTRVWVLGDSGTAEAGARAVRDAYLAHAGSRPADVWLMLGDNAYPAGTDEEYQAAVFDTYPAVLRQTPLWPVLGNHDGQSSSSTTGTGPYYDAFTLPAAGEAGGVPSGTEAYYSFDHGSVHFVALDSFGSDRSVDGPMLTWLRQDLAATTRPWVVAFWHHAPYSRGSHDSDRERIMTQMRQNVLPVLEAHGVDLVLTGHSHAYERSFLLAGHYGSSATLAPPMVLDGGDGHPGGTGPYAKPAARGPRQGTVYAVAGSAGRAGGGPLDHPAMVVSLDVPGSVVLDVVEARLDAAFLDDAGVVRDAFTLVKGAGGGAPPEAPGGLVAGAASATRVDLAWTDHAGDETGFYVERATGGGPFGTLAALGPDAEAHRDGTVAPATTYRYRVRAVSAAGASAYSPEATATTPAGPPAAPAGLTVTAASRTSLTLAWTDRSPDETGFRVERSTDGRAFTEVAAVGPGVTRYASTGLRPGTRYYHRVRATGPGGDSPYSNVAGGKTPGP